MIATTGVAIQHDQWKQAAARRAVSFIESGMVVGLGSGTTASYALRLLARRLRDGSLGSITAYATSLAVWAEARLLGIPLLPDEVAQTIDLTIDGADEVDPALNLIKGGGGALLREKIVAQNSRRKIIIVDETKCSPQLGSTALLPVEVVPFGWKAQLRFLQSLGFTAWVRTGTGGMPVITDQENLIIDCATGPIADAVALSARLSGRAGIVEHGLFLDLATDVIIAGKDGVRHLRPASKHRHGHD